MKHGTLPIVILLLLSVGFGACSHCEKTPPAEPIQFPVATGTPEAESPGIWINLDSAQNARQIGGYPVSENRIVRWNAILRTGELALLTEEDKETLIGEYKLNHIVDLRDEIEAEDAPDPAIEGVQYHHLIVWPREVRNRIMRESTTAQGFDADLYVENYYTAFALEPSAIEAYKEMFEVLLGSGTGSVLIHCVHGKDRTGIAVALILSALGVEWDVIEQEYLLSNTSYSGSVDISSLRYYKRVIEIDYGSMEKYLEAEMNLNADNLAVLREKYTVPA